MRLRILITSRRRNNTAFPPFYIAVHAAAGCKDTAGAQKQQDGTPGQSLPRSAAAAVIPSDTVGPVCTDYIDYNPLSVRILSNFFSDSISWVINPPL